jgi:hypothetical protein
MGGVAHSLGGAQRGPGLPDSCKDWCVDAHKRGTCHTDGCKTFCQGGRCYDALLGAPCHKYGTCPSARPRVYARVQRVNISLVCRRDTAPQCKAGGGCQATVRRFFRCFRG